MKLASRQKILVVLSRIPYPLDKGDKLRAYHQIKGLSEFHDIYLFALSDGKIHPEAMSKLNLFCKEICVVQLNKLNILINLLLGLFGSKPFQVYYFYHQKAHKKFKQFFNKVKPDKIFCQLIRTAEYAKNINTITKTIDYQDAFAKGVERRIKNSPLYLKPLLKMEFQRLRRYEHIIFHYFEHHTIISEQDRNYIINEENDKIQIVPNGVDLDYFTPQNHTKDFDLLFTGNMSYPPNIDCVLYIVKKVMPIILEKRPQTRILISGTSPTSEILELENKNIIIGGWVKDIRQSYARSKIFIAPMQIGTGLQNKLLEAMAMKIPCITSPLANVALGALDGEEILVGRNEQSIAEHVLNILQSPESGIELAQKGREFVEKNYSWKKHNQKLVQIITENQY